MFSLPTLQSKLVRFEHDFRGGRHMTETRRFLNKLRKDAHAHIQGGAKFVDAFKRIFRQKQSPRASVNDVKPQIGNPTQTDKQLRATLQRGQRRIRAVPAGKHLQGQTLKSGDVELDHILDQPDYDDQEVEVRVDSDSDDSSDVDVEENARSMKELVDDFVRNVPVKDAPSVLMETSREIQAQTNAQVDRLESMVFKYETLAGMLLQIVGNCVLSPEQQALQPEISHLTQQLSAMHLDMTHGRDVLKQLRHVQSTLSNR